MNTMNSLRGLAVAASLLVAAGCASTATGPEAVEKDFGNSVRHMTEAQTANPATPVDSNAIDHGDGARVNAAIDAYRKDVTNPKEVKKDVTPEASK